MPKEIIITWTEPSAYIPPPLAPPVPPLGVQVELDIAPLPLTLIRYADGDAARAKEINLLRMLPAEARATVIADLIILQQDGVVVARLHRAPGPLPSPRRTVTISQ